MYGTGDNYSKPLNEYRLGVLLYDSVGYHSRTCRVLGVFHVMDETSVIAKIMRFLPLFATVLMLVYWIYNYYYPMDA